MHDPTPNDERILVLAPTGKDGALTCEFLRTAGIWVLECRTARELVSAIGEGAAAVLVAEEALEPQALETLLCVISRQPEWSDLPLIVFVRDGAATDVVLDRIGTRANVTILERPVRVRTLLSAVKAALRARSRQYQTRALLAQLAEADHRKEQFLAVLGHELRSPLAAIRAASSTLAGRCPPAMAARQYGIIDRQSQTLARLVEDLLDISRINAGKMVLRKTRVDLNEVLNRVAHAAEAAAATRRHAISVQLAASPLYVDGDAIRLEQIVTNLVGNAIKYSSEGSQIQLAASTEAGRAIVRVTDSGLGIPADMLERIFDPFVQVTSSLTYSQGGLGLGLPLVRKLVALHGGEITAHSEGLGRGSTFTVVLPLASGMLQADVVAPALSARKKLRVLVVDDNEDLRMAMTDLLSLWGYDVLEAATGADAIHRVVTDRPDVALVDIGLPDVDGFEVARRVRASDLAQHVKMVALTGYAGEARERALAVGFDRHIVKPIEQDELSRVLTEMVH